MAGVTETNNWSTEIYRFEQEDVVEGGEDGIDNLPGKQLASRTNWLRLLIKSVTDAAEIQLENDEHTQLLQALLKLNSRVGEIAFVAGLTAPANAIKANGPLLSRSAYADLWAFAQISGLLDTSDASWVAKKNANGTCGLFSPGDGSNTFRIPDLRGDFIRAAADGNSVDSGRAPGSYQADENKSHIHTYQRATDQGSGSASGIVADSNLYVQQQLNFSSFVNASGGAESRPRNTAYIAYIFYK